MRFDVSDDAFRDRALQWLRSLDDDTVSDIHAIFRLSPGYYPTTIIALWRRELERRNLSAVTGDSRQQTPMRPLPVCHPGDHEWRFTAATAKVLLDCATSALTPGERIAHIGTPTTFALGTASHRQYRHTLLERNAAVIAALSDGLRQTDQIINIDLANERIPALGAAAAIVDPPWYAGDTLVFLAAGARVCRVGAHILLCQPTLATRPGIPEERAALLADAPELGLASVETREGAVRYNTPHFEAMSLKLAVPDVPVPPDWRRGDLLLLEKSSPICREAQPQSCDGPWAEEQFGAVRIKLRASSAADLESLVPGDVLETVSRRDPVRPQIGLWTSGNRVCSLADPTSIGKLIRLCHTDFMAAQFTMTRTLAHARDLGVTQEIAQKLFDILLIELQEHSLTKETFG